MDSTKIFSVAIDGTAASGKSTVAKILAERLDCSYLDTGKLYRAVALDFLGNLNSSPEDWTEDYIAESGRLNKLSLCLKAEGHEECRILLEDEDVNEKLSDLKVEKATPFAARLPAVRAFLLDVQRDLAKVSSVVMAGRDIGTVVLPNATLKVFIEADLAERARRRLTQHKADFTAEELEQAVADLKSRDDKDANRKCAPMACADDALKLDSTTLNPQEIVECIAQALDEAR